jgi:hypothetical protein
MDVVLVVSSPWSTSPYTTLYSAIQLIKEVRMRLKELWERKLRN